MSRPGARLLYCGETETGPRLLRDAGLEVILLGDGASAEQVAAVVAQEDVDVVVVADAGLGAALVDSVDDQVVVFWITSDSAPSSRPEARD